MHFDLHLMGNFGPALGKHLGHRMIPDHRTHDDLGHIAQCQGRIAIAKEIFHRIGNAVLHDPGDLSDIEVAGEHQGFLGERTLTKARAHPRVLGTEAKLRFEDALHFDFARGLHAQGPFRAQPWLFPAHVLPETLHHGHLIGFDRIKHGQEQADADKHQHTSDHESPRQVGERRPRWEVSPQTILIPSHNIPFSTHS